MSSAFDGVGRTRLYCVIMVGIWIYDSFMQVLVRRVMQMYFTVVGQIMDYLMRKLYYCCCWDIMLFSCCEVKVEWCYHSYPLLLQLFLLRYKACLHDFHMQLSNWLLIKGRVHQLKTRTIVCPEAGPLMISLDLHDVENMEMLTIDWSMLMTISYITLV